MNRVLRRPDILPVPEGVLPGEGHVAILLALHDGAEFLEDQLASIAAQRHANWSLIVSDDASADDGPDMVRAFARARPLHRVELVEGPSRGFAANFLRLLALVPPRADYVAFCDQDDLWMADKLKRAVAALAAQDPEVPALYGSRTLLADAGLTVRGSSPLFGKPPSFANALVQSIAGGNTMVMNRAAGRLLAQAAVRTTQVVSHDWWAYQVVSGAGGKVIYDPEPTLLYRQHGKNLVGANRGTAARLVRLWRLLAGAFRGHCEVNLAALDAVNDLLGADARAALETFRRARRGGPLTRLVWLRRSGVYRQTVPGSLALWLAAALGRV